MAMLGTREINNIECEVHASVHGSWTIYRAGEGDANERFLGSDQDSLDKAVNNARLKIKQQQAHVAVPFKTLDGKSGIAHGRHARSRGKILTKINGKSVQIDYSTPILKADTPRDVIEHMTEIREEQARLSSEHRELIKEWKLDLGGAVDKAIAEVVE